MTEKERQELNDVYKMHCTYSKEILDAAAKISSQMTASLDVCISSILEITNKDELSDTDLGKLEVFALRIPALCYYLQGKSCGYAIQNQIEELITNQKVVKKLEELKGEKGDSREKMKRAEASFTEDRIVEILNRQIYANLKETISRADKVYEGIKKIIDARVKENEYNRKSQTFAT